MLQTHVALEVTVDRRKVVRELAALVLVRADDLADLRGAQVAAGCDGQREMERD